MHPSVELIHLEANGVQSVDGGTQEGEEDRFSWRERLALLGGKRGEESGAGGDRAPSDLVFVKCRGRKIEGAERANYTAPFFLF